MLRNLTRREWFAGSAALVGVAAFPALAQTQVNRGPSAREEPVSESFFGETVTDRYRWMESAEDPQWRPFMEANAEHARAILGAIPGGERLRARVGELTGAFDIVVAVKRAGAKLFFTKRPAGWQSPALFVRENGTDTLLINPNEMRDGDAHLSLDWWEPSHDGAYVVYGLSLAGSENSVLHIMHVASREVLPERIDRTQYASPVWLPDNSGFFFNRLAGASLGSIEYYLDSVCWLHRLRTDAAADVRVLARGQFAEVAAAPTDFPFVFADPSSNFALAIMFGGVRRENPVWTARLADVLAGRPRWRQACTIEDEVTYADLRGDDLYLLTTKNAENGKVLVTSAARPNFVRARTLVPESSVVVENIAAARDAVYVQDMDAGYARLRRVTGEGRTARVSTLALPFEGSITSLEYSTQADGVLMFLTSWLEPTGVWRYDPASDAVANTGLAPRPPIDTSPYEAVRGFATARDGERVPVSIVMRRDLPRDGSNPTLVEAYGAYQIVNQPAFWTRGFAFLEQGGILVTAHVRGGGEYGKRWWKAGQKLNKPNTWRDVIDCCQFLIDQGYTRADKLAMTGTSAGGITSGRALTERPDLFCAVIPRVGVLNALRAEFSQNGPPNIEEFGTVTTEEGFSGLRAMDALHAVQDGVRYPAVLVTHGMTDPRVEPWHSGKMVARLRAADLAGGPFLLRVTFDAGHGLGSTREQADNEWGDIFAFVLWRSGTPGFQPS